MERDFTFKAPQFVDFSDVHNQSVDESFFEFREEVISDAFEDTLVSCDISETRPVEIENDFLSPAPVIPTAQKESSLQLQRKLRKSMSTSQLHTNEEQEKRVEMQRQLAQLQLSDSQPSMGTSHVLRRGISQEHLNELARPKTSTGQAYVTLAEGVRKFHNLTPRRFRHNAIPSLKKAPLDLHYTPHSPKLLTMQRIRPPTAISREEKERLEVEEARKFKIRAHPVSQKVLRGPMKSNAEKKPCTVIEPFHLTEVKKKCDETTKNEPNRMGKKSCTPATAPKPFSFLERDQQVLKKREELIKKVLEQEKKAREFHANPVPISVLKSRSLNNSALSKTKIHNDQTNSVHFKARPPSVLYIKPFSPKKLHNHTVQIEEFNLHTTERAKAREVYDKKMKEHEANMEAFKIQKVEEEKMKEAVEIQKMRKEAEHKAQPIRKYKPLIIEAPHKCTSPVSPVFHTDRLRNKENNFPI